MPAICDFLSSGRVIILGPNDEIVYINGTKINTGAVDGSTGRYTCEVCQNRGTPQQDCVNSSVPIEGRCKYLNQRW